LVRKQLGWGMEAVFRVAACSVFLMFWVTLLFYREPARSGQEPVASVAQAFQNMVVVLGNFRFVVFLLIVSGFYIVFWQEFISAPLFTRNYINSKADVDLLLSVDPAMIIFFQIAITYLTRRMQPVRAMALGFLVAGLAWIVLAVRPSVPMVAVAFAILALGEMMYAARFYEYVSRLAPPGQQGLYMGYAFLPVAIGYFIAGILGGHMLHYFGVVLNRPQEMWWVVMAVGVVTAASMWAFDAFVRQPAPEVPLWTEKGPPEHREPAAPLDESI
jgi:predicted MFS family arabinose efflux permease